MKTLTQNDYDQAKRIGYAKEIDGQPYAMLLENGETVLAPVEITEANQPKIEKLAALIQAQQTTELNKRYHNLPDSTVATSVKPGKKYTKIDIGDSGRYMVENATGNIYGIKGYGVIHRGHYFGTLDTIDQYYWGFYHAGKLEQHG